MVVLQAPRGTHILRNISQMSTNGPVGSWHRRGRIDLIVAESDCSMV